jgi:hypothetical protein
MNTATTTGAENMNITELALSEIVESCQLRHEGRTYYLFGSADGTWGNHEAGFGYASTEDVVAALNNKPYESEWAGIARGLRSGKL